MLRLLKGKTLLGVSRKSSKRQRVNITRTELARHEREAARALWDALMFAPSPSHLTDARHQLKAAPHAIQEAVMGAIFPFLARGIEPVREENPFD